MVDIGRCDQALLMSMNKFHRAIDMPDARNVDQQRKIGMYRTTNTNYRHSDEAEERVLLRTKTWVTEKYLSTNSKYQRLMLIVEHILAIQWCPIEDRPVEK